MCLSRLFRQSRIADPSKEERVNRKIPRDSIGRVILSKRNYEMWYRGHLIVLIFGLVIGGAIAMFAGLTHDVLMLAGICAISISGILVRGLVFTYKGKHD
jgi:ABC-type antimicrobial peptide transport system permease subunit